MFLSCRNDGSFAAGVGFCMVSPCAPDGSGDVLGSARRNSFPRGMRLLRHSDFERVYKQGRRHFAPHMTVFYLPRREGGPLRVGFTVGRMLGGAVVRNRTKRRLREAVRLHRPVPAAMDVVINPKKSFVNAAFADLRSEIGRAFDVIESSVRKP